MELEAEINRLGDFLSEKQLGPLNEILKRLKKEQSIISGEEQIETENTGAVLKSVEAEPTIGKGQAGDFSKSERISHVSLEPVKKELQVWDKTQKAWGSDLLSVKGGCQIYAKSKNFDYKTESEKQLQTGYSRSLIDESLQAWSSSSGRFPHWIIFDIGREVTIGRFGFINHFTSNQGDKGANFAKDLEVWTSRDRIDFMSVGRVRLKPGTRGLDSWSHNHLVQGFKCEPIRARFVKFIFLSNYYENSIYKKWPILTDRLCISMAEVMAIER